MSTFETSAIAEVSCGSHPSPDIGDTRAHPPLRGARASVSADTGSPAGNRGCKSHEIQGHILEVLDGRVHPLTEHEIVAAVRAGLPEGQVVTLGEVGDAVADLFLAGRLAASYTDEPPRGPAWEYRLRQTRQAGPGAAIPGGGMVGYGSEPITPSVAVSARSGGGAPLGTLQGGAPVQGRDAPFVCNCGPKTQGVTP